MDIISMVFLCIAIVSITAIIIIYFKQTIMTALRRHRSLFNLTKSTNGRPISSYKEYSMNLAEQASAVAIAAGTLFVVGYIFYRSFFLALLLTPFSLIYPKIRAKQLLIKRRNLLRLQFKDSLQSLAASLQAGRTIETAMKSAIADLLIQYEEDAMIIKEFEIIVRKLESNENVEKAFRGFADRSDIEEIKAFADMLDSCKRSGGNLVTAIKSSSKIISDKVEVMQEIQGIISEKKLEQRILTIMPIILILLLSSSAADFMEPVFTRIEGRFAMTVSIGLFAAAYIIAGKITDIEV